MANHGHDRTTGRFISGAARRLQTLGRVAEQPDEDYALDEAAMVILDAGMARAIEEGWIPPDDDQDDQVGAWAPTTHMSDLDRAHWWAIGEANTPPTRQPTRLRGWWTRVRDRARQTLGATTLLLFGGGS